MWCASIRASRSSTMPEMPLIEWKLRNSSSSTAGRTVDRRAADVSTVEQQAADRREVLVALREVLVHEAGEERRRRSLMRALRLSLGPSSARTCPARTCGANGLVR